MTAKTFKLEGGLSYSLEVPSTIEEFAALAKSDTSSVLDAAIREIVYRGPQADVREALCDAIEAANSEVSRNRKTHPKGTKDKDGQVIMLIDESAGKFISRAAEELKVTVASFQPLLDGIMADNATLAVGDSNRIVFDPSQSEPKGRSLKAGKEALEFADKLLSLAEAKLAQKLALISAKIGRTVELGVDREALGLALKEYDAAVRRETKAALAV